MDVLTVNTPTKRYPIYTATDFAALAQAARDAGLAGRRAVIVTDDTVAGLYLPAVLAALGGVFAKPPAAVIFPHGEASKTLAAVADMYRRFMAEGLDRGGAVIALGGGVVGDMAGFAAATYMRGVAYAQVPTTLLAQVDSSVGGKTAVDLDGVKNAVGAFYQPEFVYTNVSALKTLDGEQFASGLGEVVKHGLLAGGEYLELLESRRGEILAMDGGALGLAVVGSCRVKAAVVAADEREAGQRETLNMGHTFGHAIETDSEYALAHGACVAIGMRAALALSRRLAGLPEADERRADALLRSYGLMTAYKPKQAVGAEARLLNLMCADKKARTGRLTAVCLRRIGEAVSLRDVPEAEMVRAMRGVLLI